MDLIKTALQAIANVLQVPVHLSKDGRLAFPSHGIRHQIGGGETNYLKPALEMTLRPVATFSTEGDSTGVLVHVLGDLYLLVSHYHPTKATSVFVVDGKRSNMPASSAHITPRSTLRDVYDLLRKGIIKTFLFDGERWKQINNL